MGNNLQLFNPDGGPIIFIALGVIGLLSLGAIIAVLFKMPRSAYGAVVSSKIAKLLHMEGPSMAELFPVRDLLDNIMVRTDGNFVAGYRLDGSATYYGSEDDRNSLNSRLDSLVRTCPENSMRIQVRYEVNDTVGSVIDEYVDARRTDYEPAILMDIDREQSFRAREDRHQFLTRKLTVYFIWNPEQHRKQMLSAGTPMGGVFGKSKPLSPSSKACIRRERAEHEELLTHFDSMLRGIESSMNSAELRAERLTHDDLFDELQDAIGPFCEVRTKLRGRSVSNPDMSSYGTLRVTNTPEQIREVSVRERMTNVSLNDVTESYMDIGNVLWGVITVKDPPERTYPGVIRELQVLGFPIIISTNIDIPNQGDVLKHYSKREKKMISAQSDLRGRARVDAVARQAQGELADIQARILASSTKACHASVTIAYRTSFRYLTDQNHDEAQRQLMARRQQIMHVISSMDGAAALPESMAQLRMLINTLPGLAGKDKRDHDVLTANAADLMPVEMPWAGTPRTPMMLFTTPYKQLIPYSPFDPSHENANAIIAATSGTGKSMLVQQMLLTAGRQGVNVSILERGDSYYYTVKFMGGEMISMSLDSDKTINPFDLQPGQTEPTRDHRAFLRSLVLHMIGNEPAESLDALKTVLETCIQDAYKRARQRTETYKKTPLLNDVRDSLQSYIDPNNSQLTVKEARLAALKLTNWVDDGIYARLFDRYTKIDMNLPWLYFNIEKLKSDPHLETTMSLLIAYTTTNRASGGQRCITVLDECWSMLDSPSLSEMVVQLFRTARKRDACVWAISQAVEDFTGTPENPKPIGGAILTTTALRLIGRQKGNLNVLSEFLHLSPAAIERIKNLPMTQKGEHSEFLICIGERSETTHSLYVKLSPVEYWLATSFPRERKYRSWWLKKHDNFHEGIYELARRFPQGIAALAELPEERSKEVDRDFAGAVSVDNRKPAQARAAMKKQEVHV